MKDLLRSVEKNNIDAVRSATDNNKDNEKDIDKISDNDDTCCH